MQQEKDSEPDKMPVITILIGAYKTMFGRQIILAQKKAKVLEALKQIMTECRVVFLKVHH